MIELRSTIRCEPPHDHSPNHISANPPVAKQYVSVFLTSPVRSWRGEENIWFESAQHAAFKFIVNHIILSYPELQPYDESNGTSIEIFSPRLLLKLCKRTANKLRDGSENKHYYITCHRRPEPSHPSSLPKAECTTVVERVCTQAKCKGFKCGTATTPM